MTLEILIATMAPNLSRIADMLLPPQEEISYLVSCQHEGIEPMVPECLQQRCDVRVVFQQGRGLSRNRNHCLQHAQGDILLVTDDDCRFYPDGLQEIMQTYQLHKDLDMLFVRLDGLSKYYPQKATPVTFDTLRSAYYISSCEMTFRRSSLGDLCFNEYFGLGSACLASGEEQVLIFEALSKGLHLQYFPILAGFTPDGTTGQRLLQDVRVQRSKGATFCYIFGRAEATWMCIKESLYYFVHQRKNPFVLFYHFNQGIRYCQQICR